MTISLLFYAVPFWPQGIWDQRSPNTDQTNTPCAGGLSLDHWTGEIPLFKTFHPSSHMFIIIIIFLSESGNRVGGLVTKLCLTLATPWTVAHEAPLSMGFSRQESWSGLPFPPPGDLPNPETESRSLESDPLPADSLPSEPPANPKVSQNI